MPDEQLLLNNDLLKGLFHALPSPTFVVDSDVRFLLWNERGGALMGKSPEKVYRKRGGEILHCIHETDVAEGCGRAPACRGCVIRNAVDEAFQGESIHRRRTMLELLEDGNVRKIPVLVSASPFSADGTRYAVLIVETISDLIQIHSLIPICCRCKKIRNDSNVWESVERYIARNVIDLDFTHGYCPECAEYVIHEFRESEKKRTGDARP